MISTFRIGLNGLKTNSFFFKHYQAIKKVYSYRYSSKKLYELKDSKFSQELGLDKQMNQISKIVKSQQSSSVKSLSLLIILVTTIIGSYGLVQIIDTNQRKFWFYQFQYLRFHLKLNKNTLNLNEIDLQYEKNLKQVYDKNFKHRTRLQNKFVLRLKQYVDSKIQKMGINKNQISYKANFKFSTNLQYVLTNLSKSYTEQNGKTLNFRIRQIFQRILYFQFQNYQLKIFDKVLTKELSIFLLKYGDQNQQILGFKFLKSYYQKQKLSKNFIEQILERLEINRLQFQRLLQYKKSFGQNLNQQNIQETKLLTPRQQMIYLIHELSNVKQIRKYKLKKFKQYVQNQK